MSPVTDGSCGGAAVFTQIPGVSEGSPIEFTLKAVEQIGDGGLYLNYLAKKYGITIEESDKEKNSHFKIC